MLRIQAIYRNGDHEIERIIEADELNDLSTEERVKLFDLATGAVYITEEENEELTGDSLATLHNKEYSVTKEYEQECKKDSSVGNLTVNVNVVSNIEDFSEKFTKEFEKVLEQLNSMLGRPLSDYVTVEISTNDAQQT